MLTTIILALTLQQKTFDFDHKGAPVARVIAAMEEALDEEMSADGTMSRDYVIVAFRNTTGKRARELIAEALNASWIKKDGDLVLHRSGKQEQEDERTDQSVNTRFIRAMQDSLNVPERLVGEKADELFRTMLANSGVAVSYQKREAMRDTLPGKRALVRLIKEMEAETLAALPAAAPVTFSLNGGFGTRRLSGSARSILAEFVSDQNGLMDRLELRAATVDHISGMGRVSPRAEDVRLLIRSLLGLLDLRLFAPSSDGRSYLEITTYVSVPSDLIIGGKQWPEGLDALVELSEVAKERTLLRPPSRSGGTSMKQPSQALLDVYLSPDEHDHLELARSEIVLQAADLSGKSFVAVPRDANLDARLSQYSEVSIADALEILFRVRYKTLVMDDATFVTPMTPHQARQERFGRHEFARSLKAFRERKRDTLTPLADLIDSCLLSRAPGLLFMTSVLSRTVRADYPGPIDLLSFYAKMSDRERVQANAGGAVYRLQELDPERQALVASVFGYRVSNEPDGFWSRATMDLALSDQIREQNRWLQAINPRDVSIRVEVVRMTTPFYRERKPDSSMAPQPTSIGQLAKQAAAVQRAGRSESDDWRVFRLVEEQAILMNVISGGREVHLSSYFVPAIYEGDEFVEFNMLPKSFLDQYQTALKEEMRKIPPVAEDLAKASESRDQQC